jgi:hypothetical protein
VLCFSKLLFTLNTLAFLTSYRTCIHIALSLSLFIPNGITEHYHPFFLDVSASDVHLWFDPHGDCSPSVPAASSLRLFILNGLTDYYHLFLPDICANDVHLWFDPHGDCSPAIPAPPSLRPLIPSSSFMRCKLIQYSNPLLTPWCHVPRVGYMNYMTWNQICIGFIHSLVRAMTNYNHMEQFLEYLARTIHWQLLEFRLVAVHPLCCELLSVRLQLHSGDLLCRLSIKHCPAAPLSNLCLLSQSSFFVPCSPSDLFPASAFCTANGLTLEACFSPTQMEAHVTADMTVDFVYLETSSLVMTKHVTQITRITWICYIMHNCQSHFTLKFAQSKPSCHNCR